MRKQSPFLSLNSNLLYQFWSWEVPDQSQQIWSEHSSWFTDGYLLSVLTWQKGQGSSLGPLLEGHYPHSWKLHSHDLITSQSSHFHIPSHWWFSFIIWILRWPKHSISASSFSAPFFPTIGLIRSAPYKFICFVVSLSQLESQLHKGRVSLVHCSNPRAYSSAWNMVHMQQILAESIHLFTKYLLTAVAQKYIAGWTQSQDEYSGPLTPCPVSFQ